MDSAITFTSSEVSKYYAARVPQLKQRRAAEWRGPCPVHRGTGDNFGVKAATGEASCFSQCGRGWDILALEQALTGTDFKTAKAEVFRIVGRTESPKSHYRQSHSGRILATYDYPDEAGRLLYQAVRMEPKRFWQRRPDGNGGWIKDLKGVRLVLYRLPELLKRRAESVYICEGEKDVHTLESFGLLATCNPMVRDGGTQSTPKRSSAGQW